MERTREQTFKDIQAIGQEDLGDFSADTLHNFAQIESSYGRGAGVYDIDKKYSGTFQMGENEFAQFGDTSSSRMDTTAAGKATLKYAEQNLKNTGSWKEWGMDKRMGDLGIDRGLQAYITHQQGRGGTIDLITSLREGGKLGAGTRERILGNISSEEGTDFNKLGDKDLVNRYLGQYKDKWSKASETTAGLHKEFGGAEEGKALPAALAHIAEKKRSLEKPSISDDEVFDSIKTDEFDWGESSDIEEGVSDESFGEYFKREDEALAPKRMSAEEKKTKYDKQMSRFHEKRGLGNMPELGLRREKMTIGENIGIPNTKGRELDDIMKVLSSPDDYKVAR